MIEMMLIVGKEEIKVTMFDWNSFLKMLLNWPFVAILAIIFFKKDIGKVISSLQIRSIKNKDFSIYMQEIGKHQKTYEKPTGTKNERVTNQNLLLKYKKDIEKQLEEKRNDDKEIIIDILKTKLACARLELFFEYVYSFIYGSQICLLKKINGTKPLLKVVAQLYMENTKKRNPYVIWSKFNIDDYLHFLKTCYLIKESDSNLEITDVGREFLVWIIRNGRSESRPIY